MGDDDGAHDVPEAGDPLQVAKSAWADAEARKNNFFDKLKILNYNEVDIQMLNVFCLFFRRLDGFEPKLQRSGQKSIVRRLSSRKLAFGFPRRIDDLYVIIPDMRFTFTSCPTPFLDSNSVDIVGSRKVRRRDIDVVEGSKVR